VPDGDDMVFGDVRYREPVRAVRPDRDPRRACLVYGVPRPGDLPIFLDRKSADAIERHGLSNTTVELGGILLGKECIDPATNEPFVSITQALEARHYESTQASFTYTHDAWEALTREREAKYSDLDIVGWYHTHPDFGVFLSGHDVFLHGHFFGQPLQVALVLDPIRQTRGFFFRQGNQLVQTGGYYLVADRAERVALARFVNDLENLPTPDGGSMLSPRLEAELMSMLNRSRTPAVVDRSPVGPMYLIMGLVLGLFMTAVFWWLSLLAQDLRGQSEALRQLTDARGANARAGEETLGREAALAARERVFNALLADVKVGSTPESVAARLTQAQTELDTLRRKFARVDIEHEALVALSEQSRRDSRREAAELAALQDRYDAEVEQVKKDSREQSEREHDLRAQRDEALALIRDGQTGKLAWSYKVALWSAIAGWGAFVLSLLGIVTLLARRPAGPYDSSDGTGSDLSGREPARAPVDAPTVRIE
jgi:proteasome lid subunit RPN8/RPN11